MKTTVLPILLAILVAFSSSCAAQEHLRTARTALAAGNPRGAEREFAAALVLNPKFAKNVQFMADYTQARRDAAVEEGRLAVASGEWDRALAQFTVALDVDPGDTRAQQGQVQANRELARTWVNLALDDADRGDAEAARQSLLKALEHVPGYADATTALASIDDPRNAPESALPAYLDGVELNRQKQWSQAAAKLSGARTAAPLHVPTRVELAQAHRAIDQTRKLLADAQRQQRDGDLDRAIANLQQARDVSPHDPDVAKALDQAQSQRSAALAHVARGREHLDTGRWDDALAASKQALSLFAKSRDAADLRDRAIASAVKEHTQAGAEHLRAGRLDEAEAAYARALSYSPTDGVARRGLAEIDLTVSRAAEKANLPGHALLHAMDAYDHYPEAAIQSRVTALRRRVLQEHAAFLSLSVDDGRGRVTAEAAALQRQLIAALRSTLPSHLQFGAAPRGAASLHVDVSLGPIELDRAVVGVEQLLHAYEDRRRVANPDLRRLEALLDHAHRDLRDAEREVRQRQQEYDRGRKELPPDDPQLKRLANRLHDAKKDLSRAQREYDRARQELARAPAFIVEVFEATWPFTRLTHEATGRLEAHGAVLDEVGRELTGVLFSAAASVRDVTIENPNPAIGLAADPLELPSAAPMTSRLLADAVSDGVGRLVPAIVRSRVAVLDTQAAELANSDSDGARELSIAAALIADDVDNAQSRRRLDALRTQVRR